MSAKIIVTPELVAQFSGEDVLGLHAICQPLVDQMQVIRHQQLQLNRAAAAMDYSIKRQGGNALVATEQFTRLTDSIAEIKNADVDAVRETYFHGSSKFHRKDEK